MTLLAYIPAMSGGFIWDDESYVILNPTLKTLDGLRKIWMEPGATPQYYPMVFTSFWVQYQLWGLAPFPYHLFNVILHGLNAALLWVLLRYLRIPGAYIAAAIFAVHPVHLESVAWITERKNVLSGLFYLSSLLVYARFYRLVKPRYPNHHAFEGSHGRGGLYFLAMGLFLCALLSKTVTCSMPAVLLLLLWWKRDKFGPGDAMPLIPLFVLGAFMAAVTVLMEKHVVGAQGAEWTYSIIDRFLIAGRAVWFYVGKLLFPYHLTFIYPRWHIDSGMWWQYIFPVGAAGVVLFLWVMRNRLGKGPLVAVLIFGGTLLPALGFVDFYPMRFSFVADHFQYLASIAIIVLCVVGINTVRHRLTPRSAYVNYGLSTAVLITLGTLTWNGAYKYKDLETLWRDTIAKNTQCWLARNNLGLVLTDTNRLTEAIHHYKAALRIKPDYEDAHYNLGLALDRMGRTAQAISHYSKALSINPHFEGAHNNMGLALEKQGKLGQAIRHYAEAIRINPRAAEAHNNLGAALAALGELEKAKAHYLEAMKIDPYFVEAHNNMGLALERQGRLKEAITHYSHAINIRPDSAEAHNNLGLALARQGRLEEAVTHYSRAISISSNAAAVYVNLGNALAALGRVSGAINAYNKALATAPRFTLALRNLGILYARNKEFEKAQLVFERLIPLESDSAHACYVVAKIFAEHDRVEDAVGWLKKAVKMGFKDWDQLRADKALEKIRRTPYYQGLALNQHVSQ